MREQKQKDVPLPTIRGEKHWKNASEIAIHASGAPRHPQAIDDAWVGLGPPRSTRLDGYVLLSS